MKINKIDISNMNKKLKFDLFVGTKNLCSVVWCKAIKYKDFKYWWSSRIADLSEANGLLFHKYQG
jgi:hypothetical protein